jgi:hypothetical protein
MNYIKHLNGFFNALKNNAILTPAHVSLYMALFQYWNFNRFRNPFHIYRENIMQLSRIGSRTTYYRCIKDLHQAGYIHYDGRVTNFQTVMVRMNKLEGDEDRNSCRGTEIPGEETMALMCSKRSTGGDQNLNTGCPENEHHLSKFDSGGDQKMVTYIKPNSKHINCVCNTRTQNIFKNEKSSEEKNCSRGSEKPVIVTAASSRTERRTAGLGEVEQFFRECRYPLTEAKNFFYYNEGKGWMLKEGVPITDWKAIAHKWMLNAPESREKEKTLQALHTDDNKDYGEPL